MRHRRAALALGFCTLLVGLSAPASSAGAQLPADDGDSDSAARASRESRLFETATSRARPLSGTSTAITILDRDEIEALAVVSVAELMRFLPGVSLSTSGPRGGLATAQIRGGDPNFTLVMIDGVPLNDSTDRVGGAVNLNAIATAHIERIEVVRAPFSSFFGSSGLGGAINIIMRRGRGTGKRAVVDYSADVGDASAGQGALALRGDDAGGDYYVGASFTQEKNRVARDRLELPEIVGNFERELGGGATRVRVSGRASSWEAEDYPDASGGPLFGSGETRLSEHDELSLSADWSFGSSTRQQRIRTTVYRHVMDRSSPAVGFVVPQSVEETEYTNAAAAWTYPLVQSPKSNLFVGVELDWERGENQSVLTLPPDVDGSYKLDRTTGGAFLEWTRGSGPLVFELGARVDVPEGFDTEFGARAGISYRTRESGTRLRASAGRSFKLPSFFVLGSPAALGGNPALVPEEALGVDVAVEQTFASVGVSGALNLFYYRFDELVDFDFGSFSHVNLDAGVGSKGAELVLQWQIAPQLDLQTNVTRQEVEDRRSSQPLRHRPEWFGGARLAWKLPARLSWMLDLQFAGDSLDEQIPTGPGTTEGFRLFGSALTLDCSEHWQLRLRIDNLADEEYETFIGFPGPSRSYHVGFRRSAG